MSFENDHFSCTQEAHIDKYVLPILYGAKPEEPSSLSRPYTRGTVEYLRIAALIFIAALVAGIYWGSILSIGLGVLIAALMAALIVWLIWRRPAPAPSEEP
jgi:hypothetical protein